ncbi:unnamed protein product [Rangifer tarandus platyrhynchus]|uniref:Uncharacterized protein n=1 Tax=Rangifer tarandus platyrhynchus TaxID=3082113 RepID=A0AC59ZSH9_RANTA
MVTLITKKLQSQRLDALACRASAWMPSPTRAMILAHPKLAPSELSQEHPREDVGGGWPVGSQAAVGPASPFLPSPRGPSMGTLSAQDLRGSARSPSVLPTKRHGRSLSEPDERAISRSPRLPGGPRVWTPVTKRRCHSSGSAWLPGRALPPCVCAGGKGWWKHGRAEALDFLKMAWTLKTSKSLCPLNYEDEDEEDA